METSAAQPPLGIPPRVNVLGVGVHAVNMELSCSILLQAASRRQRGYVCVRDVHGIMESLKDRQLRDIHNRSLLTVPDGMPNVWIGRLRGYGQIGRVYGPELMLEICRRGVLPGYSHFFYGGTTGVAGKLAHRLRQRFPGLRIEGTMTPPFRPLKELEMRDLALRLNSLQPDFIWVGISTPKQERFMAACLPRLGKGIVIGVGAAFDIHAGLVRDAPQWIKPTGLQWLFRLSQEPGRLWRRYLVRNPAFLYHLILQMTGLRKYPMALDDNDPGQQEGNPGSVSSNFAGTPVPRTEGRKDAACVR